MANDNDFLTVIADPLAKACTNVNSCSRAMVPYPNQWYVFAFDNSDLPDYVPQQVKAQDSLECGLVN